MSARTLATAVLAMALGCSDAIQPRPITPVKPPPQPSSPAAPRPAWTGCSAGIAQVYEEAAPIYRASYDYQGGSLVSQYTLCADGTFGLEFDSARFGTFTYVGAYAQSDSALVLNFADSNLAGAWSAIARLHGDTLTVAYNDVMVTADFENGPYVRRTP